MCWTSGYVIANGVNHSWSQICNRGDNSKQMDYLEGAKIT